MKRIKLVSIVLMIFLMLSCGHKATKYDAKKIKLVKKEYPVKFEKEKSVEVNDLKYSYMYSWKGGVIVYGDKLSGGVLLYEYDKDLNYKRKRYFRYGQGPGEISPTMTYVFQRCKNKWLIFDRVGFKIMIFDKDFKFIKHIKVKNFYISPVLMKDCKRFVFTESYEPVNTRKEWVTQYELRIASFPKLRVRKLFTDEKIYSKKHGKFILPCGEEFSLFSHNGKLYYIRYRDYNIVKMDSEGEIIKAIAPEFEKIKTPSDKVKEWLYERFSARTLRKYKFDLQSYIFPVTSVVPLDKGFIVVRRRDYSIKYSRYEEGDYFDYELNSKGKVKVPCYKRMYQQGNYLMDNFNRSYNKNGFYLLREEEDGGRLYLEKWRVKEGEK